MADDAPSTPRSAPTRRAVLTTAAWVVPLVAATSVPASAQSGGSVPVSKLRINPGYTVQNASKYDPVTGTNRGPLVIYVCANYDQDITWWPNPDPSVAVLPYTVQVDGPWGATTLSGALTIAIGGYAQEVRWYPGEEVFPVPVGTYTFTMTLYGSDGSTMSTTSITVA